MKISIITVCYNSEKTIERTIQSVLYQSYDDIEYILVDGGSIDKTIDIIRKYEVSFIKKGYSYIISSEPDKGMYDAMNKGIHMASGDLIAILNSDDWYEYSTVATVALKYESDKNADILMGAIKVLNGNQTIIKYARNRKYKTSRDFNHPAMFVTKECYKDIGEYSINSVHDDYGWYLKAMKRGKHVVIIDEVLTNYSIGGVGSVKSVKSTFYRIGTKYKVYKDNGYSDLYWLECVAQEIIKYILLRNK